MNEEIKTTNKNEINDNINNREIFETRNNPLNCDIDVGSPPSLSSLSSLQNKNSHKISLSSLQNLFLNSPHNNNNDDNNSNNKKRIFALRLPKEDLQILIILFRICGFPISSNDFIGWKIYQCFVLISLYLLLSFTIFSSINKLNDELYSTITAILYCLNGSISYLSIFFIVYYKQYNIITLLQSLSSNEFQPLNNYLNSRPSHRQITNSNCNCNSDDRISLKFYSIKWILIAFLTGLLSCSLLFIAYGSNADTHFLDIKNNSNGWHVINIIFFYVNAGWLLPMVLIRIGSYFLERKVYLLIEYLENTSKKLFSLSIVHLPFSLRKLIQKYYNLFLQSCEINSNSDNNQKSLILQFNSNSLNEGEEEREDVDISIQDIMIWYDDLYRLNKVFADAFSLIIFQNIIILFLVILFILQVSFLTSLFSFFSSFKSIFLSTSSFVLEFFISTINNSNNYCKSLLVSR